MTKYILLALLVYPLIALGLQTTLHSKSDSRIHYVNYDPHNIVKISAKFGQQIFIKFSENEKIEDMSSGDTQAWEVGISKRENGFFIKPKSFSPNTNLTIVTDKRHYNFELEVDEKKQSPNMYMLWFRYPHEVEISQKRKLTEKQTNLLLNTSGNILNTQYTAQGANALMPYAAWDDGIFTYFQFSARKDFPAIYVINENGKESLVNTHVENDTLVVQKVAQKLIFRKDSLVTCIFNEAYNPEFKKNLTNTFSPFVKRIIQGEKDEE